jgi:hypothetical protein
MTSYTRNMPIHALKVLLNIFHKLRSVSQIANPRGWVIIFYNLSKHFQLYVAILPGKKVSTLLLVNLSHKSLQSKVR